MSTIAQNLHTASTPRNETRPLLHHIKGSTPNPPHST